MATVIPRRAGFRSEDALRLCRDLWGVDGSARELPSERDQNFEIAAPGARLVLKIAGRGERRDALEMQNAALDWLADRRPFLPVPRLVPTRSGAAIAEVPGPEGGERFARMVSFLPGRILADARPQSASVLERVGRFLGELDAALDGFSHPAAIDRDLDWNPERASDVIARDASEIGDPERRALVGRFRQLRDAALAPVEHGLRRGVIHNDANDWNVLVGDPTPDGAPVAGLLDFGDMLEAWTVCEAAVAAAYAMLVSDDPIAAAASIARGYHAAFPLAEDELSVLFPLAAARLAVSVCLSARRRRTEPDNPYLLVTESAAWAALEKIQDVPPRLAEAILRDACGLPPFRETPAIEQWLAAHRTSFAPVVAADLSRAVVFDLSVGSPELESPEAAGDTAALTAKILDRMRESGAPAAIGRYDEARLVYQSEAFRSSSGEHPEWRTVHLAADLFLPAGSPVFSPMAGRVHSLRDNRARLDYGPTVILAHEPEDAPPFFTLYGHLTRDSLRISRPE